MNTITQVKIVKRSDGLYALRTPDRALAVARERKVLRCIAEGRGWAIVKAWQ